MVNARRVDQFSRRELTFREGRVRRREIIRQGLVRNRPHTVRRLFIDRDEISDEIITEYNNQEEPFYELSFAPLSPEVTQEIAPLTFEEEEEEKSEEEEEDTESSSGYLDHLSDCSTITIDLDDLENDGPLPSVLLNAWEVNAEIRPLVDTHTQTSSPFTPPGSPPVYSDYSPPNYSPVRLEDIEALETESNGPIYSDSEDNNSIIDTQVNAILDFLENEDFSNITL